MALGLYFGILYSIRYRHSAYLPNLDAVRKIINRELSGSLASHRVKEPRYVADSSRAQSMVGRLKA